QNPEQINKEFTTTAYLNVWENLKLPTKDQAILEDPASSTGTLSSLQNLDKELSFTNQFFVEKPQKEEPNKTNTELEVQSMVMVPIHQDTSSVPQMITLVIDLTVSQPVSTTVHAPLPTSTKIVITITTTTSLPPPPSQPQQSTTDPILVRRIAELKQHMVSKAVDEIVTDAVDWAMQAPLQARFSDLPACDYSNQLLEYLDEARRKKRKRRVSPRTPLGSPPSPPPHPPPPASASGAPGTKAPSSSKTVALALQSMAWTTYDTRYDSGGISRAQELSPTDSLMHDDSIPDEQVHFSNDEDSGNDHLLKADLRKDWWKPLPTEERLTTPEPAWTIPSSNMSGVENNWASALVSTYETSAENSLLVKTRDMTTFMNWYCRQVNRTKLTQADFEGQDYKVVEAFYPDVIHLQFQIEEYHKMLTDQVDWMNPEGDQVRIDVNRPLPLGCPLGHDTIQTQFFFNKDLKYLRYGSKGSSPKLLIYKIKAARSPYFSLKLLVRKQMWIDDVCSYDISAKYDIFHWWFNRQKFYTDRHDSLLRQKEVRTHMRILSVVRLKAYSRYRSSRSSSWFRQTDAIYCYQAMDPKLSDSIAG
ncbi:hypothetical protein Tco_0984673, partial [Tanacetum coccineum]